MNDNNKNVRDGMPWLDRVAHDLRGPLMPLQTASYLLRSGQLDAKRQQELFEVIERQTRRMARMIDELADWSRASEGRLLGGREACEIPLLLDNAIEAASLSGAPDVTDHSGDVRVHGDPARLVQLLRTVLEFATRRQPARVCLRIADGQLEIDVTDLTCETDDSRSHALFEQPLPEPADEGLGLRLLIARKIAEAHAGTMQAQPSSDGGLCLRCRLPLVA